jgi:hypothetical protein
LRHKILHSGTNALLVTGPPASGKTSLLQLMRPQIAAKGKTVYVLSAIHVSTEALTSDSALQEALANLFREEMAKVLDLAVLPQLQYYGFSRLLGLMLEHFDYVFLDDAQTLYLHRPSVLAWLLKPGATKARIVFFASVPPEGAEMDTHPVLCRLDWNALRLSQEEQLAFERAVLKWAQTARFHEEEMAWLAETLPVIRAETDGHAGLLRLVTQELIDRSTDRQVLLLHEKFATAMQRFYLGALFWSTAAMRAGFMEVADPLDDAMREVLRCLVEQRAVEAPPAHRSLSTETAAVRAKRALLRMVIVVAVDDPLADCSVLRFPTPMHRRFWFRQAYASRISQSAFEAHVGNDIDKWLLLVLQHFQSDALSQSNSNGHGSQSSSLFPRERTFQHEFWRGASLSLPPHVRVAAEVSKGVETGKSRFDFWVQSTLHWAVELVRNTDASDRSKEEGNEHLARFQQEGQYYNLRPSQWRVLEFRPANVAVQHKGRAEHLIIVHCKADFKGATVYFFFFF